MSKQGLGSRLARVLDRARGRARRLGRSPSPQPTRAKSRGTAYPGDFSGTPEISYEPNPGNGKMADPGEIVSRRERSAAIRDAVSRLPEAQRVAVVLRYFADLAYADIAELTQQTVNNVGVTLLRARERLRRDLEAQGVATDGLP